MTRPPSRAVATIAIVSTAVLLFSCATRPAPAAAPATPAASAPAAAGQVPASSAGKPPRGADAAPSGVAAASAPALASVGPASSAKAATRPRDSYLEASLAEYLREKLPNGVDLAIKRQAGRRTAVARILLSKAVAMLDAREAGYEALGLSTAVAAATGDAPGSLGAAVLKAGASLSLRLEDYDDVALELVCPAESLADLLSLVARSLASPAFDQPDFDRARREARVAERRDSGDPLLRAEAELRSELFTGHPYSLPPRGTAASLAVATREGLARFWSSRFSPQRLSVVAVADLEPAALAKLLEPAFGALASRSEAPEGAGATVAEKMPPIPIKPWFRALALSATPGSAVLHGEFSAPDAASPDYPALSVALLMLDDLLMENLRGEKVLVYGAWTRLSAAAAPSASITVYKTSDPATAKAAIDAAIAGLASGVCLDANATVAPIARSLEAYKARAVTAAYSRGASSEGMAARIARDLAAGGDGTAMFRLAGRIREVKAEDVARVARQRLLEGPSAWIALGDPELVSSLPASAFVTAARGGASL